MDKRTVRKLTVAMGVGASLLIGSSFVSSAWAAPCAAGSVSAYTSPGFSCSVGPLTFSNFTVAITTGGAASVVDSAPNAFNPTIVNNGGNAEYGFSLSYSATAIGTGMGVSTADLALTYDVASSPGSMVDAYMSFAGGATGLSTTNLSETLSNGSTMNLFAPGVATTTFAPITWLSAIKDQGNSSFTGDAFASVLVDGFSVSGGSVPEPGTIALFGAGLLGGAWFLRRRRSAR